jgi:hypothetical protein
MIRAFIVSTRIMFSQNILDKTGMLASGLCAVHCLVLPVFLSFSAFSGISFLNDSLQENSVLVVSFVLGVASFLPSYFKHHRKMTAIIFFLLGFLLIGFSRVVMSNFYEALLTSTGALLITFAHYCNYKLCKRAHAKCS